MFGEFDCRFKGVDHLYLQYGNHERQANRPGVVCRVMLIVELEVCGFQAESDEVANFSGGETCSIIESRVRLMFLFDDVDAVCDRH